MFDIKKILFLIIIFSVFSFISCSITSSKKYEVIHGKNYQLYKVYFHKKGATEESVLNAMKYMQITDVMRLLEHKYGINIDYSEYAIFLANNDPSKIHADGLLSKTEFMWESPSKLPTRIEYAVFYDESRGITNVDKSYTITFFVDNKRASHISSSFSADVPAFPETANKLRYQKAAGAAALYTNMDTQESIDLDSSAAQKMQDIETKKVTDYIAKQNELKALIQSQTNTLPKEQRKQYKTDIINYLNEIIQD